MSLKKKLLFGFAKEVTKGRRPKGFLIKVLIGAAIMGILLTVGLVALVGYGLSQVGSLVQKEPNVELVALQDLMRENKLVLTEEQEALVIPSLRDMVANPNLSPEEAQQIEDRIVSVLTPVQMEELRQKQEAIVSDSRALGGISLQVIDEWLVQYTGLSVQRSQEIFNSILAWWEVKDPRNQVPNELLEQIEK